MRKLFPYMINRIFFEFSAKKREKKLKNVILVQEVKKPMDDYKQKLSYIKGGGNPLDLCLKQSVIMNF